MDERAFRTHLFQHRERKTCAKILSWCCVCFRGPHEGNHKARSWIERISNITSLGILSGQEWGEGHVIISKVWMVDICKAYECREMTVTPQALKRPVSVRKNALRHPHPYTHTHTGSYFNLIANATKAALVLIQRSHFLSVSPSLSPSLSLSLTHIFPQLSLLSKVQLSRKSH